MKKIIKGIIKFLVFAIKAFIFMIFLLFIFIGVTIYQNNSIVVTKEEYVSNQIPKGFDGYKVIHLSDLHSEYFGEDNEKIIKKIKKEKPDVIFITGDLVDANRFNAEAGISLVRQAIEIAPIYYVYGNHEMILNDDPENNEFKVTLEKLGVTILNNEGIELKNGSDCINLVGIQDPSTVYKDKKLRNLSTQEDIITYELGMVTEDIKDNDFTILLSHRPEYMDIYKDYPVDLVLSGHAHGGQFRLPFIGGVYAPNQGVFPKYTAGVHTIDDTTMIISRGLGNSKFPIRILNTPEIVSITLKSE